MLFAVEFVIVSSKKNTKWKENGVVEFGLQSMR